MELQNSGSYIDAPSQIGGPMRFVNQAPSDEVRNSKWLFEQGKIKVKTLQAVQMGCEFYLDSSSGNPKEVQFSVP